MPLSAPYSLPHRIVYSREAPAGNNNQICIINVIPDVGHTNGALPTHCCSRSMNDVALLWVFYDGDLWPIFTFLRQITDNVTHFPFKMKPLQVDVSSLWVNPFKKRSGRSIYVANNGPPLGGTISDRWYSKSSKRLLICLKEKPWLWKARCGHHLSRGTRGLTLPCSSPENP